MLELVTAVLFQSDDGFVVSLSSSQELVEFTSELLLNDDAKVGITAAIIIIIIVSSSSSTCFMLTQLFSLTAPRFHPPYMT